MQSWPGSPWCAVLVVMEPQLCQTGGSLCWDHETHFTGDCTRMLNWGSFIALLWRESLDAEEVLRGLLLLSLSAHQEPTRLEKQPHSEVFFLRSFQCKSSFDSFYLQVHRFRFCGHQRCGSKVNLQLIWIAAHAEGAWLLNLIRGVVCRRQKLLIHKEGFIRRHL